MSDHGRRSRSSARFRFKAKSSRRHGGTDDDLRDDRDDRRPRRHRRRNGRKRRHPTSPQPPLAQPAGESASLADPDIAFRESLFDAMGDDEGAAYWESVYGQPVHTYSAEKVNSETGELERMSEEEYIAFVRRGMWERSREGIQAAKEELKAAQERERVEEQRRDARSRNQKRRHRSPSPLDPRPPKTASLEREVEESLRRGRERKEKRMWLSKWSAYNRAWDRTQHLADSLAAQHDTGKQDQDRSRFASEIVWPVESGTRAHVNASEIERFMTKTASALAESTESTHQQHQQQHDDPPTRSTILQSNLKIERVRWHPDKVQHRFGALRLDDAVLKTVTEVFQAMDGLYSARKGN